MIRIFRGSSGRRCFPHPTRAFDAGSGLLLELAVGGKAVHQFLEVYLVPVELGSVHARKTGFVAKADAAAAAHSPYGGLIASGWHTALVWMKLMMAYRQAQVAAGATRTQENYVSPGLRDLKWLKPVRPGMTLTYTNQASQKLDWPSLPAYGLLEGNNEALSEDGTVVYSFVNRVLIARRPSQ